jgi:hypothetical protein
MDRMKIKPPAGKGDDAYAWCRRNKLARSQNNQSKLGAKTRGMHVLLSSPLLSSPILMQVSGVGSRIFV